MGTLFFVVLENELQLLAGLVDVHPKPLNLLAFLSVLNDVLVKLFADVEEDGAHFPLLAVLRRLPQVDVLKGVFSLPA